MRPIPSEWVCLLTGKGIRKYRVYDGGKMFVLGRIKEEVEGIETGNQLIPASSSTGPFLR